MSEAQGSAAAILLGYFEDFLRALANALGIAEKLSKLAPDKRNRRLFEEVLEPIHERLLEVHTQYLAIFNWFSTQLPMAIGDKEWLHSTTRELLNKDQVAIEIGALKCDFEKRAGEFNSLRTSLRAHAESYIKHFDPGSPERGFIWATIEYFLRRDFANQTEERLIAMADMIAEKGSHSILSTPASGVLNRISEEEDPTVIGQIVDLEKIELAKRFSDVSRCFYHAKRELLRLK